MGSKDLDRSQNIIRLVDIGKYSCFKSHAKPALQQIASLFDHLVGQQRRQVGVGTA